MKAIYTKISLTKFNDDEWCPEKGVITQIFSANIYLKYTCTSNGYIITHEHIKKMSLRSNMTVCMTVFYLYIYQYKWIAKCMFLKCRFKSHAAPLVFLCTLTPHTQISVGGPCCGHRFSVSEPTVRLWACLIKTWIHKCCQRANSWINVHHFVGVFWE